MPHTLLSYLTLKRTDITSFVLARTHSQSPKVPQILHSSMTLTPICVGLLLSFDYFTHTHTHPYNGLFSGFTLLVPAHPGNLDFTEARDIEWQWHKPGDMQVCTSLETDNHASTPPLSFLQAGCPSGCPTNSVKALKALL